MKKPLEHRYFIKVIDAHGWTKTYSYSTLEERTEAKMHLLWLGKVEEWET